MFNKSIHELYRSLLSRMGLSSRFVNEHPNVHCVKKIREELPTIGFKSLFQEALGIPTIQISIQYPEVNLYSIKDCWITGCQGFIYPDTNSILRLDNALENLRLKKIIRPIPVLAKRMDFPVFHLAGNSVSRAHIVMEHLSRFQIAESYLREGTKVLIYNGQTNWQTPYLKGANIEEICETSYGTIFCRELYYVPIAGESVFNLIGEPVHYLQLRRKILANIERQTNPIFISREDAPDRRLSNENHLFEIAKIYFPTIRRISLSSMSFEEQISCVSGAPIVISPHGQGAHLTLFCSNAISIQLVPGKPEMSNSYYECALLFDYFASLGGTQTLTTASGLDLESPISDWFYPESHFEYIIKNTFDYLKSRR